MIIKLPPIEHHKKPKLSRNTLDFLCDLLKALFIAALIVALLNVAPIFDYFNQWK